MKGFLHMEVLCFSMDNVPYPNWNQKKTFFISK
jgi:hypothetical protein